MGSIRYVNSDTDFSIVYEINFENEEITSVSCVGINGEEFVPEADLLKKTMEDAFLKSISSNEQLKNSVYARIRNAS